MKVWVVTTWEKYESAYVEGVYATKEAAQAAIKALPNMRLKTDPKDPEGLHGEPVNLSWLLPHWAAAEEFEVQGGSPEYCNVCGNFPCLGGHPPAG